MMNENGYEQEWRVTCEIFCNFTLRRKTILWKQKKKIVKTIIYSNLLIIHHVIPE